LCPAAVAGFALPLAPAPGVEFQSRSAYLQGKGHNLAPWTPPEDQGGVLQWLLALTLISWRGLIATPCVAAFADGCRPWLCRLARGKKRNTFIINILTTIYR